MSVSKWLLGCLALLTTGSLTVACATPPRDSLAESGPTPGSCPSDPPGPPSEVGRQEALERIPPMAITLRPPSESDVPAICGNEALATAWREEAEGSNPTRAIAKLTDFEGPNFGMPEEVLVWVVSYKGFCVPIEGPEGGRQGCAGEELNVVVDATTGEYQFSYSYR